MKIVTYWSRDAKVQEGQSEDHNRSLENSQTNPLNSKLHYYGTYNGVWSIVST
jgi:hypothetical protein